jgi:hypothetical protein
MIDAIVISEQLAELIEQRLDRDEIVLRERFAYSTDVVGARHVAASDLLLAEIARNVHAACPRSESMRLMNSFRERKNTSKNFDQFDPLMASAAACLTTTSRRAHRPTATISTSRRSASPPEQPVRSALARADAHLRQALRILVPQGLGRMDVFERSMG